MLRALLWGCVLTSLACDAGHLIGSAGFVRSRGVEPTLSSWLAPQLFLADLDGDGATDLAALDPDSHKLCIFRLAAGGAQGAHCQGLLADDALTELSAAQPDSADRAGPPRLVAAGRALLVFSRWTAGQDLAVSFRQPLPEATPLLHQSQAWTALGPARDELWTVARAAPGATAWTGSPAQGPGPMLSPVTYPLSAAPTALLPVVALPSGQRELFVATTAGIEHYTSQGAQQALPCPADLAESAELASLDVDGDGDEDLLARHSDGRLVTVQRDRANKSWQCGGAGPLAPLDPAVRRLHVADFDGDGLFDLLASTDDRSEGLLLWRRGQMLLRYPLSAPLRAMAVADFDSDGRPDIALLLADGSLELWHNSF